MGKNSCKIALCDFGLCHVSENKQNAGVRVNFTRGTAQYMAPEAMNGIHTAYCPFAADIYSLGVFLYVILTGFFPQFHSVSGDLIFPEGFCISAECEDFLLEVLNPNPTARPTIKQLLRHRLFSDRKQLSFTALLPKIVKHFNNIL